MRGVEDGTFVRGEDVEPGFVHCLGVDGVVLARDVGGRGEG